MLIVDVEYLGFYKAEAKALVKCINELFSGDIGIRTLNPSNVISRIANGHISKPKRRYFLGC